MVIPGFVLAGGQSRRMGRDKALVEIEGVPLALRMARVLLEAGCSPVILVGRQLGLAGLGLPVISDDAGEGSYHPLSGVAAALEEASAWGPLALVCPCDLVQLRAEDVRLLLEMCGPCVARCGERIHPLLAVIPVALASRAAELAREGLGAHVLTGAFLPVDLQPEALVDANRPEELPQAKGGT